MQFNILNHLTFLSSTSFSILQYGRSLVPMDANNLGMASYSPSKTLQLLGFTSLDTIPRHYYMSHTFVMVANKDIKSAGVALAALVQAMVQSESVAILRFVRTTTVEVLMAQPVPASGVAPAHFILNAMPFREDIRTFPFGSFDRDDRRPTQAQLDAALHLVDSMPLTTANKKEDLVPENTANPALHRFIDFFVDKALDSGMQVQSPEDDMMLQRVLTPSQGITPGASEAAALAAVAQFPTGHAAKALRRAVRRLSAGHEVEDFKTMMEQRKYLTFLFSCTEFLMNSFIKATHPYAYCSLSVCCLTFFFLSCRESHRCYLRNAQIHREHCRLFPW